MERFSDLRELRESKDSLINKIASLTDEQKKIVKEFFNTHNDYENKIDWNRVKSTKNPLTWKDFEELIDDEESKLLPKEGLSDLTEGVDYEDLPWDKGKAYAIYNHRASVAIASNNTEPKTWSELPSWYQKGNVTKDYPLDRNTGLYGGAKWCTAMNHTDRYFREYTHSHEKMLFYFIVGEEKLAVLEGNGYIYGVWDSKDISQSDAYDDDYETTEQNAWKALFTEFFKEHREQTDACLEKFKNATPTMTKGRASAVDEFGEEVVDAFDDFWGEDAPYERLQDYYIGSGYADEVIEQTETPIDVTMIGRNVDMEALGEKIVDDSSNSLDDEEMMEEYGKYYNEANGMFEWEYEEIAVDYLNELFPNGTYADDLRKNYLWLYDFIDFEDMAVYSLGWEDHDGHWFQ